jgi:SM-20-related protein
VTGGAPWIDPHLIETAVIERMAGELARVGYAIAHHALDPRLTAALRQEAAALGGSSNAIDAGIGRDGGHALAHNVRQSRIQWMDGATTAQSDFLTAAEAVRVAINQQLFLGLFEFEAQLALYQPGGCYARHIDSFSGARNRIVSLIAYLTPEWGANDGGELVLWPDRNAFGDPVATVTPEAGTLVLMMSEDIPHEVRIAHQSRASIAGWWRGRPS